jgi:transcriptional regulator with XRE-family HTH domain
MAYAPAAPQVGPLLRDWRKRRRLSQLDLALEAGVSARHVSFIETGRSTPSPEMLLRLAGKLDVPQRESNELLIAAGYAPRYGALAYEAPEMDPVRRAIDRLLAAHEPYPAVVVDRHWELIAANQGIGLLTAGVAPELLEPPVNALRLALHPDGMARRTLNLAEWRVHILERLERHARMTGDPALHTLLDELRAYPGGEAPDPREHDVFVPLVLAGPDGTELRFLSTVATFGTAVDVTAAELSIESFFPADDATAAALPAR